MTKIQSLVRNWNLPQLILFRLAVSYFGLYIFLMCFGGFLEIPIRWIGSEFLDITYDYKKSGYGSGDNTFSYVKLLINVVSAFIVTILWSVADFKRKQYIKLCYWFVVILRLFLILFMLLYGYAKVFGMQFRSPSLLRLLQPLGEFSPMGLAWTYMGYSKAFSIFAGLAEMVGGLLLIPRRTITIGALVVSTVMFQVVMMNLCFDIPVKLFSIHLLLMALTILVIHSKPLVSIFIKNKSYHITPTTLPIEDKTYHKTIFIVKIIGLISILGLMFLFGYRNIMRSNQKTIKPALYGIWEADIFLKNEDTLSPLINDKDRWHYLVVDRKNRATIVKMNKEKTYIHFLTDTTSKRISIFKKDSDTILNNFSYHYPNKHFLQLKGEFQGNKLDITFSKIDHEAFLLNSRGFNWINEKPYNR